MAKIPVKDLAKMMGLSEQDLVFKLKSIGVRLDDENPSLDKEIIEAVLKGKSMRNPREVILRDKEAAATAKTVPAAAGRPKRRMPLSTRRPPRRRTIIQRVEPRIRTIPASERAKPAEKPAETAATAPAAPAARTETAPAAKTAEKVAAPKVATVTETRAAFQTEEEAASGRRKRREERKKQADAGALPFKEEAPTAPVMVSEGMTVREFAEKLGVKVKDLMRAMFDRGIVATINQTLDPEVAVKLADALGVEAMVTTFEEEVQYLQEREQESENREPRAPVVTIMGHVDHGKTTLLDSIRSSKVTESEFGGITQHIGAYQVQSNGHKVVFLDTPGHEAFTLMRARGARVTDIVVLVVAADDSVMPQTAEAIDHARAAGVPILVAINKIDKTNANVDRVKKDLSDHDLTVEEWGGETVAVELSALKGQGISDLLEMIQITSEMLELQADPSLPAQGIVLEARKEAGRGIVATVLIQDGTLSIGDIFVSGATHGRVRSMNDDVGERVDHAGPATPVEVTGFGDVPQAGDPFQVVEDESKARSIAEYRQQELRRQELAPTTSRMNLEKLFSQIQEGSVKELPLVVKADVQGSVEVLTDTLKKLSTDKVEVQILHAGVGGVTTNDVILASASNAIIVGFNVRPEKKASEMASQEGVDIRLHTVIYELSDEIRKAMTGLLEPTFREETRGRAEVREIFSIPRHGVVAGCHVVEGTVSSKADARVIRDNVVVHDGKIASLRRFKDDVSEVRTGYDCGIRLERYQDVKPGDIIEAYEQVEIAPTL